MIIECPACSKKFNIDEKLIPYSRSYLRHLFKAKELLFSRLISINNLNYIKNLMNEIRNAIKEDRLYDFYLEMKKNTTYFI